MKVGMNLLLWTTKVGEAHYPLLGKLRKMGFDGVEIPVFEETSAEYLISPPRRGSGVIFLRMRMNFANRV